MRQPIDHTLPPDENESASRLSRVIVIAPTRAACETIELALSLRLSTYLETHYGARVRELAASGRGFGIVAGTGTGKTLATRPIAEELLGVGTPLRVGVVNREREATAETAACNVLIVTTGVARRWFETGSIRVGDTLIVDEIHQTSAELELCLALGKRVGCRFIWLSATVDPAFYAGYLNSTEVLQIFAFDERKAAVVSVIKRQPLAFLDEDFFADVRAHSRGVGIFLATRAGVEKTAQHVRTGWPDIHAAHYHGGEPIRAIRGFLEGTEPRPFVLAMTAAGQSALNVPGLDTVVIDDTRFANFVERGRNVLTRVHLGSNELLQMAGRVHGRVEGGRVFILSERRLRFSELRPTAPDFQLAGEPERVALTAAAMGVDVGTLELPVPLDQTAYRRAVTKLKARNIIDANGHLSDYGRAVEALPVERPWAELLVNADEELLPFVAVCSAIESLHRMTRDERNLDQVLVPGSDHLTAYNLYAAALRETGSLGQVHGLPRHLFDPEKVAAWSDYRGVLVKALEDAALATASVYRALSLQLPARLPFAGKRVYEWFADLLARFLPFDLVIDEQTASREVARVSKTSVCGSTGAIAGELRYFADRHGNVLAAIEGTELPEELLVKYSRRSDAGIEYDSQAKVLVRTFRLDYSGFRLDDESEVLRSWDDEVAASAARALAGAVARGLARHPAVDRDRFILDELDEVWRRSGGQTRTADRFALAARYEEELRDVRSLQAFVAKELRFDFEALVSPEVKAGYLALPDAVVIRDEDVPIEYDVEPGVGDALHPVARLHLREKLARTLVEEELPTLDRPLRFAVARGRRGVLRADTLSDLQQSLDMPWMDDELAQLVAPDDDSGRPAKRRRGGTSRKTGRGRRRRR